MGSAGRRYNLDVRSSVEALTGNRVRLTVEVDEAELEPEIDAAFRRIAKEVRVPGFRPGRAPRRLLETRLGHETGRAEAFRVCLPEYYERALIDAEIDVIASPEIEVTGGAQEGALTFDAVVEVRPEIEISGYDALRLEITNPVPTEEEIDSEVDGFLRQFSELNPVSRPAGDGDHLTIDITGTLDGEEVAGLTTSDYDYWLGQGAVVPELDENLRQARAGDILEFSAAHPDPDTKSRLRFRVLVKEVFAEELPTVDDDFVAANTEHETVDEFRADFVKRVSQMRFATLRTHIDHEMTKALAALVTDELPEALVESGIQGRINRMAMDLSGHKLDLEDYLSSTGQSEQQLRDSFREDAELEAKVDLALRAVAAAEGLEADDEAVDTEVRAFVAQSRAGDHGEVSDTDVDTVRTRMREMGLLLNLRHNLAKRAASQWINERAVMVDRRTGETIDSETLVPPEGLFDSTNADEDDQDDDMDNLIEGVLDEDENDLSEDDENEVDDESGDEASDQSDPQHQEETTPR